MQVSVDTAFTRALNFTLDYEGGWSDHPRDPGGATMRGITLNTYSLFLKRQASKAELRRISESAVWTIYKTRYWDKVHGDELPLALAVMVFDATVNAGKRNAVRIMQRALNASGKRLAVDGALGPKTIGAAQRAEINKLIDHMSVERMLYHTRIKTFPTFGKGWTRRIFALDRFAQSLVS